MANFPHVDIPVYPWGFDGPAFIPCPGALAPGTVPAGGTFLHVGDTAVAGRRQWHTRRGHVFRRRRAAKNALPKPETEPGPQ